MFNDLMAKLRKERINAYAYADDLAMIGISKTNLLNTINIVEVWARDNKLTINKKKSGVMIHKYRGKAANSDKGLIRDYPYKD
jgi:hypothetical protein